jgi:TonB family protein
MSHDFRTLVKQRSDLGTFPFRKALGISLGLHLLLAVPLFLPSRTKEKPPDEVKVTWVTLPSAGGTSGGSSAIEEGKTGERLRRVEEVAPDSGAMVQPMKATEDEGKKLAPTAKGSSKQADSKGVSPLAAKGKQAASNLVTGAAGQGGGGGIGQGTGIPGLKASAGAQGGSGLIGELDGSFPYDWYLQQLQNTVTGNWSRLSSAQGRVQIYFRIRRDGRLDGARVEIPSGNAILDQSALLAVRRSDPLPRLPEGFEGDSLGVRFWFTYLGN